MRDGFDPDVPIARAHTPPASWYVDPAHFERERATTFARHWVAVALAHEVAAPGGYVAETVLGEPVVVVRGDDGVLRAFHNVCRHHAAPVARGQGCATSLVCHYHGWTYRLDGSLRSTPRMTGVEDFDRGVGLLPLPVTVAGPLVLVHLGADPAPPPPGFAALLDARGVSGLVHVRRRTWELACNWKVFCDNYLDGGYHIAHAHPGLAEELSLAGYTTECFDRYSVQRCPIDADGTRGGNEALYLWLHPTTTVNVYGAWMDVNRVLPLAVDRTRVVFDWYVSPEVPRDAALETALERSFRIQDEDVGLCEDVQRGLTSRAYDRGRYAPSVEVAEHHFHGLLARDLAYNENR